MQFLKTWLTDAKATGRCLSAWLDASGKKRQRKKAGKALNRAYHEIGTKAQDKEQAKERKSYGSVEEDRAEAEKLESSLAEKRSAEQAAKEEIAARAEAAKGEIGKVDAEYRRLADEHKEAKEALAVFVRKMREIDDELERPAEKKKTDKSPEDLRAELESLKPGREEAKDREQAAKAVRDAKKEELEAAKKAWKDEEAELTKKHWALIDEREAAEQAVRSAQSELDGSLEDLGKSVALAGMTDPDFAEPLAKAKENLGEIQTLTMGIEERRAEMGAVKKETTRFTLVTLAAIAVIVGLVILLVTLLGGDDGKEKKEDTGALEAGAGAGRAVASVPAAAPGREPNSGDGPADPPVGVGSAAGAPAPAKLPAGAVRAVLDQPFLAEEERGGKVLFRVGGEPTVTAAGKAAGGGRWAELDVPAERRFDPEADFESVVVHVRIVLDAAGRIVSATRTGLTDEGTRELDRLLGAAD